MESQSGPAPKRAKLYTDKTVIIGSSVCLTEGVDHSVVNNAQFYDLETSMVLDANEILRRLDLNTTETIKSFGISDQKTPAYQFDKIPGVSGAVGNLYIFKNTLGHQLILKVTKKEKRGVLTHNDNLSNVQNMVTAENTHLFVNTKSFSNGDLQIMEMGTSDVYDAIDKIQKLQFDGNEDDHFKQVVAISFLKAFCAFTNDFLECCFKQRIACMDFKAENIAYFTCNVVTQFRMIDIESIFSIDNAPSMIPHTSIKFYDIPFPYAIADGIEKTQGWYTIYKQYEKDGYKDMWIFGQYFLAFTVFTALETIVECNSVFDLNISQLQKISKSYKKQVIRAFSTPAQTTDSAMKKINEISMPFIQLIRMFAFS